MGINDAAGVFGLWTSENELRISAAVPSSRTSGAGARVTNRTWSAYWSRAFSIVGRGVVYTVSSLRGLNCSMRIRIGKPMK